MKKCKISFCGAGKWVRSYHIPELEKRNDRFEIRGFYDVFAENSTLAAGEKYHVFNQFEDLLQDIDTDVVVVATKPVETHFETTMRLLEAGKNVILEKPMTYSVEQCDLLIAKAKEKKVLFTINHNLRASLALRCALEVMQQGHAGEIRCVEITSPRSWYDHIDFSNYAVHMADQALAVNRSPLKEVTGFTTHPDAPLSSCGYGGALLRFEEGPVIMLSLTPSPAKRANEDAYPFRGYFRFKVCGTKDTVGICDMNHIPDPEQVTNKTNCYFDIAEPDFTRPEFFKNLSKAYYDFFYESWADGAPLLVTPEEGRNAIRCVELITESARLNRTVTAENMLPARKDFII